MTDSPTAGASGQATDAGRLPANYLVYLVALPLTVLLITAVLGPLLSTASAGNTSAPALSTPPTGLPRAPHGLAMAAAGLPAALQAEDSVRLDDVTSGMLLIASTTPGLYAPAASVATDAVIRAAGPVARVVVRQHFRNPHDRWLEALYVFPLPEDAAVDHLRMQIGERRIEGVVQEKQQARATYQAARAAGQRAALLEQHRPNLFTTAAANIPPHGEVVVEIEYQQLINWRDGGFALRFPTAITPRFQPGPRAALVEDLASASSHQGWSVLPGELPNVVPVTPASTPAAPLTLRVELNAGFPLAAVTSSYHEINVQQRGGTHHVRLDAGSMPPDRDFELRWRPQAGSEPRAAFFSEHSERGHYGLLMVLPPQPAFLSDSAAAEPATASAPGRQITFIVDKSGSMGGASMRQAQAALSDALYRLTPQDAFNIVLFDSQPQSLFGGMRPASSTNVQIAIDHVGRVQAGGGTDMAPALALAFAHMPSRREVLQQVVFITDGAVGNEAALMQQIHAGLDSRRLFTVGIGAAPNSHFMTEAAHFGRGTFVHIGDLDEVQVRMQALLQKLDHTALTDLALHLPVPADVVPDPLPDVYLGEPVVAVMKMDGAPGSGELRGRIGQLAWSTSLNLAPSANSGIETLWARNKIRHWLRAGIRGSAASEVRDNVLRLALDHHLVSPYTSLVAVDTTPVRPADATGSTEAVPAVLPAGHAQAVVRSVPLAQGATPAGLQLALGTLLLLLAGAMLLHRCRRPARVLAT